MDRKSQVMQQDEPARAKSSPERRRTRRREAIAKAVRRLVVALGVLVCLGWQAALAAGAEEGSGDRPLLAAAGAQATAAQTPAASEMRIPFPVIRAAGALERRGKPFRLAGVAVTAPDLTCGTDADAWPCGRLALTAIRRFVRTRTIVCTPVPAADGDEGPRARCLVGEQDIAKWLVTHGWARAEGPTYAAIEAEARKAKRGIFSPFRPVMTARAPGGDISEGDAADARVRVEVDLSDQRLTLIHRGAVVANWPVSTARSGKITPTGRWYAQWLSRHHRSSLYNNAPMPYSVFFNGDYAIHGTDDIGRLGRPASAGCIRLHPRHAAVVFDLARREGLKNTLVVVRH